MGKLAFQLSPDLQHGVNARTNNVDEYMHYFYSDLFASHVHFLKDFFFY